nr:mitochondrial import receptor subunit tom22 [Quercus suber]
MVLDHANEVQDMNIACQSYLRFSLCFTTSEALFLTHLRPVVAPYATVPKHAARRSPSDVPQVTAALLTAAEVLSDMQKTPAAESTTHQTSVKLSAVYLVGKEQLKDVCSSCRRANMVKLEEVPDEELHQEQPGPKEEDDEWGTDDESDISDLDDDDIATSDETLLDRISALKDIVPPTYRTKLSSAAETGYTWAASGLSLSGKTLWVVSTSVLLLGVPWALAFSEEQQVQEMEREMRAQQGANELLTQGAAKPAL